jgi:hypothetical protein
MEQEQRQALANYFRILGGRDYSLLSALRHAASLSPGGKLNTENFWRELLDEAGEDQPRPA